MLAHSLEQVDVAGQRQLDSVLDLKAGALAGILHGVNDLARDALAAKLVVELQLEGDRVIGLAFELIPPAREHHEREILRIQALFVSVE